MTTTSAFIGRQPVLNRNQQLIGYELLFRPTLEAEEAGQLATLQADTQVLVNTLHNMGTSWLIGNKLAFINVGEAMLASEFLELLPGRRVILDLASDITPSNELIARIKYLHAQGFGIAMDGFSFNAPSANLLEHAKYVKLDVQAHNTGDFQMLAAQVRSYPVIRIAEKVETHEHFHLCRELGMDGFQGYYFAKPETLSAKVIHPSFAHTLELLNLLRMDAEVKEVESVFKRDVALSYKLLRYVNSAAAGLNTTISSFNHAVTVLGYKRLYRWLTLLLVTANEDGKTPPALQKTAIVRARFMELLGTALGLPHDVCESLFVIGMFSLLDVLFDMPMTTVLEHIHLPEQLKHVLLDQPDKLTPFLRLAQASEDKEMRQVPELSRELGLSPKLFNQAHVEALAWVEELSL